MWKIKKALLYAGLILVILQKAPIILEYNYELFRTVIYLVFGILLILSLLKLKSLNVSSFIRKCFLLLFCQLIVFLFLQLLEFRLNWFDLVEVAIPLSIMIIGLSLNFSEKEIVRISVIFIFLTLLISAWQIYYYQGDFLIHQYYTIPIKNSIGPFLVISLGIIFYLFLFMPKRENEKKIKRLAMFLLTFIIGFYFALIIRSRSALLALLLFVIFLFIKKRDYRLLAGLVSLIIILALSSNINIINSAINPIVKAFTLNYDIYDIESISAGRYSVYKEATEVVKEYPLLGISKNYMSFYGVPHNYILNKLVSYGIIGSLFFLIIYLFFAYYVLKNTVLSRPNLRNIGAFIFIIPLVISLFEYTYPFGPGTANIFAFLLLSQNEKLSYVRNKAYYRSKSNKNENNACIPMV